MSESGVSLLWKRMRLINTLKDIISKCVIELGHLQDDEEWVLTCDNDMAERMNVIAHALDTRLAIVADAILESGDLNVNKRKIEK